MKLVECDLRSEASLGDLATSSIRRQSILSLESPDDSLAVWFRGGFGTSSVMIHLETPGETWRVDFSKFQTRGSTFLPSTFQTFKSTFSGR